MNSPLICDSTCVRTTARQNTRGGMSGRMSPTVVAMLAEGKISQAQARAYEARSTRIGLQTTHKNQSSTKGSRSLEDERGQWLRDGRKPLTLTDLDKSFRPERNKGIIYAIRSPSKKWYIGQTVQWLRTRFKQHAQQKRQIRGCRIIARAFAKYGSDSMELWVLESSADDVDLNNQEVHYIHVYDTMVPNGYNLTPGGEKSPMHMPDVRKRSSMAHKKQWKDSKHRAKMSKIKKSSTAVKTHMAKMRASKPKIDYWSFTRADAIRMLKSARLNMKYRSEKNGVEVDLAWYDKQITEHTARPHEKYFDMLPSVAVRILRQNRNTMVKYHQNRGRVFDTWWHDMQIKLHEQRAERTSFESLPSAACRRSPARKTQL